MFGGGREREGGREGGGGWGREGGGWLGEGGREVRGKFIWTYLIVTGYSFHLIYLVQSSYEPNSNKHKPIIL